MRNAKKKKKLENGVALDATSGTKIGTSVSPEKASVLAASAKKLKLGLPNGGQAMERAERGSVMLPLNMRAR